MADSLSTGSWVVDDAASESGMALVLHALRRVRGVKHLKSRGGALRMLPGASLHVNLSCSSSHIVNPLVRASTSMGHQCLSVSAWITLMST